MKKFMVSYMIFVLLISLSACKRVDRDAEMEITEPASVDLLQYSEPASVDSSQQESSESVAVGQASFASIEVEPQCKPSMGFSFELPEGWFYEITQTDDVPTSCVSVNLRPDAEEIKGNITIEYCKGFGVCGTGLKTKEIDFNGYEAWQGSYGENPVWEFIVLTGDYQNCVIINSAENWYEEYEDTINLILSTVQFKQYE